MASEEKLHCWKQLPMQDIGGNRGKKPRDPQKTSGFPPPKHPILHVHYHLREVITLAEATPSNGGNDGKRKQKSLEFVFNGSFDMQD